MFQKKYQSEISLILLALSDQNTSQKCDEEPLKIELRHILQFFCQSEKKIVVKQS